MWRLDTSDANILEHRKPGILHLALSITYFSQ
jgi:hypothetical protein